MKVLMIVIVVTTLSAVSTVGQDIAANKATSTPRFTPTSEYVLGVDDVIEVFVWKEPALSTSAVVRPDGKVSLPLAGELDASGRSAAAVEREIAVRLARFILSPQVNVIVKQVNSSKLSILGNVRQPNLYPFKQRITVLEAIALAGGFTEYARRDRVTVIRDTPSGVRHYSVNVDRMLKSRGEPLMYLEPFDVVYVN